MRKNNCKLIRRELDELMLGEAWSTVATGHLRECAECREFHEQQTKLRQIVGSLGTIEAPADFDFRLRAQLVNGAGSAPAVYWAFVRRGLAVAAMVIVFATGALVVRNVWNRPASVGEVARQPQVQQPVKPVQAPLVVPADKQPDQVVAGITDDDQAIVRKTSRPRGEYKKRSLSAVDFSSERAAVINGAEPVSAAFLIDAAVQSFTVSLDDGRGNAKTISVPTISFGSQRIVQSENQFAPKRDW
jgi:hypothetical protein